MEGAQLGSGSVLYAINEKSWNALPDNVKKVMLDEAPPAQRALCAWLDHEEKQVRDKIIGENGFKVMTLSAEQAAVWQERVSAVADDWAKEADATGKDGSGILGAFREAGTSK